MIRPAEAVPLGRSGLQVTRLGLGMRPLGLLGSGGEATGRAIIEAAATLGIRYLDTAPTYGDGESERRLGEVSSAIQDSMVVSTKVGKLLAPSGPRRPVGQILKDTIAGGPATVIREGFRAVRSLRRATNPGTPGALSEAIDYSYDGTMRSFEGSLARVGRDRLDIVLIHDPDDHLDESMAGAYRALERLRAERAISAIGVGSNHWQPLVAFAEEGDFDCFLLAGRYSLLDQTAHTVLLPLVVARGISLIIGGVFNGGILAEPGRKATFDYLPASQERLAHARRISDVCSRHAVDVKAAAIQFPFRHPAVTSVLVGAASVLELEEDERLARTAIPSELWQELEHEGLLAEGTANSRA